MRRLAGLLAAAALTATAPAPAAAQTAPAAPAAHVAHVFTIVVGDRSYRQAFGVHGELPYLARTLRAKGTLLPAYAAVSKAPLPNRLALVSGQRPVAATRDGCRRFDCAYPATVPTLPDQLELAGRSWKAYLQDLPAPCPVPQDGRGDPWPRPTRTNRYVTRDNPFAYFHSITDQRSRCLQRVVALDELRTDLRSEATTPAWSYVDPGRCRGKRDAGCATRFLRRWVPRILAAPAFEQGGLLVITSGAAGDARGRVGALLIGPGVARGGIRRTPFDHYSYLRSMQDLFGLPHLGRAADDRLATFQSAGVFQP